MKNYISKHTIALTALIFSANALQGVTIYFVDGFTINCKNIKKARNEGDAPIANPLQFQYITQDAHSCLVQLKETPEATGGARVALLTFDERNVPGEKVQRTPSDLGIRGNWQFFYVTKAQGQNLYGFVDYGNNASLMGLLEAIKVSRNGITPDERSKLQMSAPKTFKELQQYGAQMSQ